MITTKMFAEAMGVDVNDAKTLIRGHNIGGTKIGRTVFLDEDDLRRYAQEILPAQIEKLETKKAWQERLTQFLKEAEKDPDTIEDFVTVHQASEMMGCSAPVVLTRLRKGQLSGRQISGIWFVRKSSIPTNSVH